MAFGQGVEGNGDLTPSPVVSVAIKQFFEGDLALFFLRCRHQHGWRCDKLLLKTYGFVATNKLSRSLRKIS